MATTRQWLHGIFCCGTVVVFAAVSQARSFAPFDNGLGDVVDIEAKAMLLKELGFGGMTSRPGDTGDLLEVFDRHELEVFATYVVLKATPQGCPIPLAVVDEMRTLEGRDTVVWLGVTGDTTREIVIRAIRETADLAAAHGLRVVLYPHVGFQTATVRKCLNFAREADRTNVGLSFNLCHFLKQNDARDLALTLREAAPFLELVSINGADQGETKTMGWDQLIQPLGEGSFPVKTVLNLLDDLGYDGPVLLQCYNVERPAREHLTISMVAWQRLTKR